MALVIRLELRGPGNPLNLGRKKKEIPRRGPGGGRRPPDLLRGPRLPPDLCGPGNPLDFEKKKEGPGRKEAALLPSTGPGGGRQILGAGLTLNRSQRASCSATYETPTQNQVVCGRFSASALRQRVFGRGADGGGPRVLRGAPPRVSVGERLCAPGAAAAAPAIAGPTGGRGASVSPRLGGILT